MKILNLHMICINGITPAKKALVLCLQPTVQMLTTEVMPAQCTAQVILSSCPPDGRGVHFHLSLGDKKVENKLNLHTFQTLP